MTLNLQTPFPTFGGSTGGWLRSAEVEEKYAITISKLNIIATNNTLAKTVLV